MKRRLFIVVLLFICLVPKAWGFTQYPDPNRQTMWNNLTDSLHTLGKSPQQAQATRIKFRRARSIARLNKINQPRHQGWFGN